MASVTTNLTNVLLRPKLSLRQLKMERLLLLEEKERRLCEKSFYFFVKRAWDIITPDTPFVDAWFYQILCNDLQVIVTRVIENKTKERDYLCNLPPRLGKSKIITVCLNAWAWVHRPSLDFMTCSRNPGLAGALAKDTRHLIESEFYQRNWDNRYKLTSDAETTYQNDKGGHRYIVSPKSYGALGFGADVIVLDDIDDSEGVYREIEREAVRRFANEKLSTRYNKLGVGVRIMQQQRLHEDDYSGWTLKNQPNDVKKLCLPAEDSDDVFPSELRKFYVDGLLFPERLSHKELEVQKRVLRNAYSGNYLQNPITLGGNVFKERWFRWYTPEQRPNAESVAISVDASFSDSQSSANCSIQVWQKTGPNFYLLEDDTDKMSGLTTVNRVFALAEKYKGACLVVEQAASGWVLIEALKKKYSNVHAIKPTAGKEARAEAMTFVVESGNIFLPENDYTHVHYLPELLMFPNGRLKDRVDSFTMAINFFLKHDHRTIFTNVLW